MIEHERSFLIKKLPENLEKFPSREIIDIYFPKEAVHPLIRLRKRGEKYESTKKSPIEGNEKCVSKSCKEETIKLSEEEFNEFMKLDGKKLHKIRYDYNYNGKKCAQAQIIKEFSTRKTAENSDMCRGVDYIFTK